MKDENLMNLTHHGAKNIEVIGVCLLCKEEYRFNEDLLWEEEDIQCPKCGKIYKILK